MVKSKKKQDTGDGKPRIFLFAGEDDYSSFQKLNQWIEAFRKKHSTSGITRIDAEDMSETVAQKIRENLQSAGLFSTNRLLIVKNAFQIKADLMADITEILDSVDQDSFLIFWEGTTVKKNLKLYKKISKLEISGQAKIYEFSIPGGVSLSEFIKKYAAKKGFEIEPTAVERLGTLVGRDLQEKVKTASGYEARQVFNLWQVTGELDKLATFRKGDKVREEDVLALVVGRVSDNIFALSESIGTKNHARAQTLLDELLDEGKLNPTDLKGRALIIVGALASQFRSLLLLSSVGSGGSAYSIASELGWSGFRVSASQRLLQHFSEAEIRTWLRKLLEMDRQFKSTTLPPKVLLSRLIQKAG